MKKVARSKGSHFLLPHLDGQVCVHHLPGETPGTSVHYEKKASQQRHCDALSNDLLGNLGFVIHEDVTLTLLWPTGVRVLQYPKKLA